MPLSFPRWLLISLLTLVLLTASLATAQGSPPTAPPAARPDDSSNAARTYDSFTRPSRQTAVASRVAGLVDELHVVEGQSVKANQPLLQLDATSERLEVEMSRMAAEDTKELEAAQLVAGQSKSELQRAQTLLARNAITENELEQRQLALKVAELRVRAAESAAEMARLRHRRDLALLQQRTITAPGDGIVLRVLKQKGEAVERLETVLEIVQLDPLEIILNLPAETRPLYSLGQAADVTLEGRDTTHAAIVTSIDPTIDFASGTYRLKVQLPNPAEKLPSGIRARVTLLTAPAGKEN